jgi:hypothetical protein
LVAQLKQDWRNAPLGDADRAMLEYIEKLTVNPSGMTEGDLTALRTHFSEDEAYDIVLVACFFNFVDRVADAFGVELDAPLKAAVSMTPDGEAFKEFAAQHRAKSSSVSAIRRDDPS